MISRDATLRTPCPLTARPRGGRLGFSLPELIMALMLLGMAAGVMMPLMLSVSRQRRAAEQRQYALVHAENLLDEVLAAPWQQTAPDRISQLLAALPANSLDPLPRLPDLQQSVTVADQPEEAARQITVELRWRNHAGQFTAPLRLTGWKYSPQETQP